MRIDWWTLGFQVANLLVLIWILARYLFRPVAAIITARKAEAVRLLVEARAAREAAAAEQAKAEAATAAIAENRAAALQQASEDAKAETAALLAAAREQASQLRNQAQQAIERTRASEAIDADGRACRLAVDIAARLLSRLPESARIAGFIGGLAEGVAALPEAARASIGADGAPVPLRAARALTEAEAQSCRDSLAAALGRPVTLAISVDPTVIAGLELDSPHAVVRNSFRADLERIAAALAHDSAAAA